MMQKLTKLKLCIESNPKKEYDIVKEFLLSNKLFDVDNFQVNKLKNFLHFIKGDFLLDPTKNIKENILDILNGNEIEKPHISNELNDFKNADFKNELIKQNIKNIQKNYPNNLIEDKEDNEDCIVKNLKRYPPKIILSPNESNSMSVHKKPKSKIKERTDYRQILWDHLMTMAHYDLDVDCPYPVRREEDEGFKPHQLNYSDNHIRYRHYGRTVEGLVKAVSEMPEGRERTLLTTQIAQTMKRQYLQWNRDTVDDALIAEQLGELSDRRLTLPENFHFTETTEILAGINNGQKNNGEGKKKKKKKKKNNNNGQL